MKPTLNILFLFLFNRSCEPFPLKSAVKPKFRATMPKGAGHTKIVRNKYIFHE